MKKTIAIVEDERAIRDNYAAAFSREGYTVRGYPTGARPWRHSPRDCRTSRSSTSRSRKNRRAVSSCAGSCAALSAELPIIFLTARDSELDAVSGLRLGADDFLTKDLSLAHLSARVNALFRRVDALRRPHGGKAGRPPRPAHARPASACRSVGRPGRAALADGILDRATRSTKHPGHVKNRQQLMDAANVVLDDNTITSHIKRIRRKFQVFETKFDGMQTVYGMGYRWVE